MNRPGAATLAALLLLCACHSVPRHSGVAAVPRTEYVAAAWSDLPGGEADASSQAWPAILASCQVHSASMWDEVCAAALQLAPVTDSTVRDFFTAHFQPVRIIRGTSSA